MLRPCSRPPWFVYSHGAHRALHSFPTRRSSDLNPAHIKKSCDEPGFFDHSYTGGIRRCRGAVCRSEEHTSELQSRGHLVCRLLLEKKKTTDRPQLTSGEPRTGETPPQT